MKYYYQDDYVTIYHGDCGDIVPGLPDVDLVLTDPPYGMKYQSNHRKVKHEKIKNDNIFNVDEIYVIMSKAKRASYFFCRWDNISMLKKPKSIIAWVKNNWSAGDLIHEHGRMWEACCFYPANNHKFINRIPDVIQCNKTLNNLHPTEKPVKLLETIIGCNVCDDVLDPYSGSGTTLRAAKNLNKKSIGIEISEKYCEIAAKRCSQEVFDFS